MSCYPKISVITPCFNDFRFIEKTIRSVLDQHYPNLEYIVIDGGSTDGTLEIIRKYKDRLAYWISEPDQGMYDALQKGFAKSTGEIMGWINADDRLHHNALFTIGQVFGDFAEIQWLQGLPNSIDENDRIVFAAANHQADKLFFHQKKHITSKVYIQQESTYWRRELWFKAGNSISTDYRFAGDFELWMRFFELAKLHHIYALIGTFRLSVSGQASVDNYGAYVSETLEILDRYPLSPSEKRQIQLDRLFSKIERLLLKIKTKIVGRLKLNKHYVENNYLYFLSGEQKFVKDE